MEIFLLLSADLYCWVLFSSFFLRCCLYDCRGCREAVIFDVLRDRVLAGIKFPCLNHLCARFPSSVSLPLPTQGFMRFDRSTISVSTEGVVSILNLLSSLLLETLSPCGLVIPGSGHLGYAQTGLPQNRLKSGCRAALRMGWTG